MIDQVELDGNNDEHAEFLSAFTVAELGEMLPHVLDGDGTDSWLKCEKLIGGGWRVSYQDEGNEDAGSEPPQESDIEADARGKMLIYLLENELSTPAP